MSKYIFWQIIRAFCSAFRRTQIENAVIKFVSFGSP